MSVNARRISAITGSTSGTHSAFSKGQPNTFEDDRLDYDEQRFLTLGFLDDVVVSIVHTESPLVIRIISFRRATRREEAILFQSLKD